MRRKKRFLIKIIYHWSRRMSWLLVTRRTTEKNNCRTKEKPFIVQIIKLSRRHFTSTFFSKNLKAHASLSVCPLTSSTQQPSSVLFKSNLKYYAQWHSQDINNHINRLLLTLKGATVSCCNKINARTKELYISLHIQKDETLNLMSLSWRFDSHFCFHDWPQVISERAAITLSILSFFFVSHSSSVSIYETGFTIEHIFEVKKRGKKNYENILSCCQTVLTWTLNIPNSVNCRLSSNNK